MSGFHKHVCAHTYTSKYIHGPQIHTELKSELFKYVKHEDGKLTIENENSRGDKSELVKTEASNCMSKLPSSDQLTFVSNEEAFRKLVLNYK